jgi:hypothetical protein
MTEPRCLAYCWLIWKPFACPTCGRYEASYAVTEETP